MFITTAVKERLLAARVEVFFVSGQATRWWNSQRTDKANELALLGGWYWTVDGAENGPFRTPSGAWRDVYYRHILEQKPPGMNRLEVARAEKEAEKGHTLNKSKQRRKRRTKYTGPAHVVRLRA